MTNRKITLRLLALPALMAAAISPTADAAGTRVEPDRALMEFRLPANAALEIQGHRTDSAGAVRQIRSTPLEPGERYVYDVRAIWREGGQTRSVEREVRITAGEYVVVDFQPDPLSAEERAVLDLTNSVRAQSGLPPLQPDLRLMHAARGHSANMARHNTIAHTLDNGTFVDRMRQTGYVHVAAGENCAQGQPTPAAAVQSWVQSPGHRANLLNPRYTEIGIGIQTGTSGQKFWAQLFARPAEGGVVVER